MDAKTGNTELVTTKLETTLVMDERGRMLRQRDPERSPAPRLLINGFQSGNVGRVRHDIDQALADRLSEIVATEPSLHGPDSKPGHWSEYVRLLTAAAPITRQTAGVMYIFPEEFTYSHQIRLVCSGTPEGAKLSAELQASGGMPEDLVELGFNDPGDFWEPWCVAMHRDQIASIGFTARLGEHGAESGIVTVPYLRRRGYAAAAVSGWAKHPELRSKTLFYSADRSNVSSRAVAEQLELIYIGSSFVIF